MNNPYHVIIGTKAQLVKMAPVMLALDNKQIAYKFVLTGQHQETMSDLISSFSLKQPDIILYTKQESDTTGKLIQWLFQSTKKAWSIRYDLKGSRGFLIHGDTLSTLWGAIFAHFFKIKVIHIEAGLRSKNIFRPFPEEIIRRMVTFFANVLFSAGDWATNNISSNKNKTVINTEYNTILDSLKYAIKNSNCIDNITPSPYVVVSIHRVENVLSNKMLNQIMNQILIASDRFVLKMVLHPITRRRLSETGWDKKLEKIGVDLIPRMNYVDFMKLLNNSTALITDGGSNQEEASYLGLPTLLMRKETERMEGLNDNITLSNIKESIMVKFIESIHTSSWNRKKLPTTSPSNIIANHLISP